ncbi:MAG: thymidine phosphorylase [Bacilli bacterium]|nr:thymidine phosphorylase [Bacilli bacterium]
MNIIDIIVKKKNKQELTYEEMKYAIDGYIKGNIKDYQMSALLMAITINDMTKEETINLTKIMIESGDIIDLSSISGIKVDKHSTGGVGDKTTIVLIPLVASCGVNVAKMSGRGLGHTGGTIDKLESIEGYQVNLSKEEFISQISNIGCAVISQTNDVAKADKYLYALRDVTGTTESIPLIASSIMSKKIASGNDAIVIDVKVGNGALMKNIKEAQKLSKLMIEIGKAYNKKVVCVLTNMEQPLGQAIGNGLEIIESINTLKNIGPSDLKELIIVLGTIMVSIGKNIDEEEARKLVLYNLENNNAYSKFEQMIEAQHGNINNIKISDKYISIKSNKEGYINKIDAYKLGEIAKILGAGRFNKEDSINYKVGIVLNKKVGDKVLLNEELMKIYVDSTDINISDVINAFDIKDNVVIKQELIIDIIK